MCIKNLYIWFVLGNCGTGRQRGGVSPFMFGLMMGMAVFSVGSFYMAQQELARMMDKKKADERARAEDIAKAVEFTLLTQQRGDFTDSPGRDRIMANTTLATDKTASGDDALLVERQNEHEAFGYRSGRVAITVTDDTLLRSAAYRAGEADELLRLSERDKSVVTVDMTATRQRQVAMSAQNMEAVVELVYAWFAGHMQWPTVEEFDDIVAQSALRDAWGEKFDYVPPADAKGLEGGVVSFETPWNYVQQLKLSLKDDSKPVTTETKNEGADRVVE